MLDTVTESIHERVAALVHRIVGEHDQGRPDRIAISLREAGLTSLDMVKLVLAVEDKFGIVIEPDDMDPENFETLGSIERLVTRAMA